MKLKIKSYHIDIYKIEEQLFLIKNNCSFLLESSNILMLESLIYITIYKQSINLSSRKHAFF